METGGQMNPQSNTKSRAEKTLGVLRVLREFSMSFVLLGLAIGCLIGMLYTWNKLTFTCQRLERGHINCQRSLYVWLGQVKDTEQLFNQLQGARQVNSEEVFLETATDDSDFLYGFGPDTAERIDHFIDSNEQTLLIESNVSFFVPVIFFYIGIVTLALAVPGLRRAYRQWPERVKRQQE
jgi:cell division protein FtsX